MPSDSPSTHGSLPSFADLWPEVAKEIAVLLRQENETTLAFQVSQLKVLDRCRCGDSFCSTIYTQPKPKGSYAPSHRNICLAPTQGMIVVDVVDEKIVCLEILFRDEIRERLLDVLP